MKVLDLQCASHHGFEGWFASEDEFQRQLKAGLVACPFCGATDVVKRLSAPRLNLGAQAQQPPSTHPQATGVPSVPTGEPDLAAELMQAMRRLVAATEDVGTRFTEEARKMHYGESPERGIRGQATPEQARDLLEEGIPVLPLALPKALKEPLH